MKKTKRVTVVNKNPANGDVGTLANPRQSELSVWLSKGWVRQEDSEDKGGQDGNT